MKDRWSAIPAERRKQVVRVMAGDKLTCPGDDSFQNEMIRAAGGILPQWGKNGFAQTVGLDLWRDFNPQVIYGCPRNEKVVYPRPHMSPESLELMKFPSKSATSNLFS